MDKTPLYHKMSEKAEEVQKSWEPSLGDICVDKHGVLALMTTPGKYHTGIYCGKDPSLQEISYYLNSPIWLPRQDQLQEMVVDPEGDRLDIHSLFDNFNRWQMTTVPMMEATGEKLWLAFVMWNNYQKVWNARKEDWVSV